MKLKQKIALTLVFSLLAMNFSPLVTFAASNKKSKAKTKKELKIENAYQARLEYINVPWWQGYNDQYLNDYIKRAFDNNQDLKLVTLQVEEARQGVKMQLAAELPNVSVGVSPLLYKLPNVHNTEGLFSVPLIANYEIDLFLKNHDKTKSAKKTYEASKFSEKAAYISVISVVGATYYNIIKLDEMIDLQQQIISDRNKIYDLMKQSNEIGIISTADLVKADKARIAATTQMIEYKKSREVLLNSLAVLIGDNPNNTNEYKRVSYKSLGGFKPIPKEISSEIITSRPDYMVAEKMVEKAGIDVRVAKKEFLPKLDIYGIVSFATGSVLPAMSWDGMFAGLVGSAMLPLFTGGQRRANLRIQKNRYEQALEKYYKTNLTAIQEVNDALSNLKLDDEKYTKNLNALQMEQKDFKFTQDKYNQGVISYLDLLQKKETLLDIQKLVASSKIDCYVNQISLYKAVAGADL